MTRGKIAWVWLLGIALPCLLMMGCGKRVTRVEAGDQTQVYHRGNGADPSDLDPQLITGDIEHHIVSSLLEGLVAEDPKDLHPVPGVAERWEISEDGKTYTFYLRKNAKWSNGDAVTADDFYKSYQRILSPGLLSEYNYMLFVVENAEEFNAEKVKDFKQVGFQVIDPYTFQVKLKNSTPYFLSLITHPSWYPVHMPTILKFGKMDERGTRWTRPGNFVGNGAFRLSEWKVNNVLVVTNSPTYWDAKVVRLKEIRFYPTDNQDAEERSFRAGQLHSTYEVPLTKIEVYKKQYPDLIHIDPLLSTYFYRVNVKKPPMDNLKLRKALAMAIDRELIVEKIRRGGELPAYNLTPPGTAGYTARAQIKKDFAGAKKLLAEAGYPDGKGCPPIEILINTHEAHKTIAEAIQSMWKENLGLEVTIANQEWKVYLDTQKRIDYQVCRAGWSGDYVDPNSFLDLFLTGGGNNETGWSNKEYDNLIAEAGRTGDQQKRMEVFQKAEAILMDELPIIPIYFYTRPVLRQPSLKGYYPNILDLHPFKWVYLESTPGKKE
ncbi:MAG: transporter substrate-binding protein [Verrucomicrobiales bacterium]|nr:transporter substrate-binding protein [Verrucomicrobiales bacterium]